MVTRELINPKSIVVVGGSNDIHKPGGKVIKNLIDNRFSGELFVMNPKEDEVQGIKSFRDPKDLPQTDLAIIAIATATVLFPAVSKALKNKNETEAYKNLNQAFWLLSFLLGAAMVGGILLAEPIVWLLFERGKFTTVQTLETVSVLKMYMVGLLPF